MITRITNKGFDGEKVVTQKIPEADFYKPRRTKEEALKLALEAIEELRYSSSTFKSDKLSAEAITAIKEALAQPAQETKIGCVQHDCDECTTRTAQQDAHESMMEAASQQRPWVGLTDGELSELSASGLALWVLWRAIEAKLKEKNLIAAGNGAFYGFPQEPVSTSNAGGKCVTAGETAPTKEIDPNAWAFDRGLEST
jgi:hypothetical protein